MNRMFLGLIALGACVAANAQTTTIVDSIDGYTVTNGAAGLIGYYPGSGATYVTGEQFTSTVSGYISSVEMTMFDPNAQSGKAINFGLYSDRGGCGLSDKGVSGNLPVQYSNRRTEIHEETKTKPLSVVQGASGPGGDPG